MNKVICGLSAFFCALFLAEYSMADYPAVRIAFIWLSVAAFLIFLFQIYQHFLEDSYPIKAMATLDSKTGGTFHKVVERVNKCNDSIELHKKQNRTLKNSSEQDAYTYIYEQAYAHMSLINTYLGQYDKKLSDINEMNRVGKLMDSEAEAIEQLVHKLSELDNLYIELEASTFIDGTERIDDLIASLKEMTN